MTTGFNIWLTGVKASGKTEFAKNLLLALEPRGQAVEIVDNEDVLKENINSNQQFIDPDEPVTATCQVLNRHGVSCIVKSLNPYLARHGEMRCKRPDFIEIYLQSPNEDAEFEAPQYPDLTLDLSLEQTASATNRVLSFLEKMGYLEQTESAYTEEEEEKVRKRLEELGYI